MQVVLILLGAMISGGLQLLMISMEQNRRQRSVVCAIRAEANVICRFIRTQKYPSSLYSAAAAAAGGENPRYLVLHTETNYFTMYDAAAANISLLAATEAMAIVDFYTRCCMLLDCCRRDGWLSKFRGSPDYAQALTYVGGLSESILSLGEQIDKLRLRSTLSPRWISTLAESRLDG